ncbi:MAG TPA: undecaprenyl-diphosphate phosphatase [Solirubrobacteraceae bacterium]|nr:undecaprenyl-diphosphate phosphatase [Solirubrobacteraceae bacterium]
MKPARAALIGALHGPAELLPVSSSAHVALLAGGEGDPELRKAFEVALHAGTAAALLVALRGEVAEAAAGLDARRVALLAGSFIPPAVAGLALERRIERRLGTPVTTAAGLAAGALAMWWADSRAERAGWALLRSPGKGERVHPSNRRREDAGLADGLLLGLAQAAALWPGVSRGGATLTVLRVRGYPRADAGVLSRHTALPVIAGATALKGARLARRGLAREHRAAFATGTTAAFAATLACVPLVAPSSRHRGKSPPLWPFALYRLALAAALLLRRATRENREP